MIILHMPGAVSPELALKAQNEEDLYLISKIIRENDILKTKSTRKILLQDGKTQHRKTLMIKISVLKVSYKQQDQEISVQGKVIDSDDPAVANGLSQSIHIHFYQKVTITPFEQLNPAILNDIRKQADQQAGAKMGMLLVLRDGHSKFAFMDDSRYCKPETIKVNISRKNLFNISRIQSQYTKYYQSIIQHVKLALNRIPLTKLYILGQKDLLTELEKALGSEKFKAGSVIWQVSKASCVGEAFVSLSKSQQEEDQILQKLRKNIQMNSNYFVGVDAINCLAQQLSAVQDALILKSQLTGEFREQLRSIVQNIEQHNKAQQKEILNVYYVNDDSEIGERLKSFGGVIVITKFEVCLLGDVDQNIGKEFTDWWTFKPLDE